MDTLVIIVVLGSALLHAVWNAIIKGGADKLYETVLKTNGGTLTALCILPFVPLPHPDSFPYLAATICIHFFYYLFIAYAYRGSDLSYAYTIMRGASPLFTALATVFVLQHSLSGFGWAGVLLLSGGVLTLAVDAIRRGGFSLSATAIALGNALVIMGYTIVDGTGVRLAGNPVSYVCWGTFLHTFPILTFTLLTRGTAYFTYAAKRWHYGFLGGACSILAYGLALWGMTRAPISMVAALRETSVVFGVLFAVLFLKEKVTPARILAVALVLTGAAVMRL